MSGTCLGYDGSYQGVIWVVTGLRNENDRDRAAAIVFQIRISGSWIGMSGVVVEDVSCS